MYTSLEFLLPIIALNMLRAWSLQFLVSINRLNNKTIFWKIKTHFLFHFIIKGQRKAFVIRGKFYFPAIFVYKCWMLQYNSCFNGPEHILTFLKFKNRGIKFSKKEGMGKTAGFVFTSHLYVKLAFYSVFMSACIR